MILYVIRHGQVDVNVKKQLNGRNESVLTKIGIEQAKNAMEEIKNLKIDLIICSPLKRTKQTCEIININQIPVIYDDRIIERDTNSMMYKIKENVDLNVFYDSNKKVIFNDCEGFGNILERVQNFIEEIKQKYSDKNVLIVTHGDICQAIYCNIHKTYNKDEFYKYYPKNCEVAKYEL